MNIQQQHKAAVALTNTDMVRGLTDPQLVSQFYAARDAGDDVVRMALSLEMERRGEMACRAKQYFTRFKQFCTNEQLDRVAAKFDLFGSLAVWAESELVARCDWSL